jgi:hypothetical protein
VNINKQLAESVEATIRHYTENEGFTFTASYDVSGEKTLLSCTITQDWEFGGLTLNPAEFSFVATCPGHLPCRYSIQGAKKVEEFLTWSLRHRVNSTSLSPSASVPTSIVFLAGMTELVVPKTK